MARLSWLVGLVAASVAGCGGIQEPCEGEEGCVCFANDSCMAGLSCLSDLCVDDSRHHPGAPREVDSGAPQSRLDAGESLELDGSTPESPEPESTVPPEVDTSNPEWPTLAPSEVDGGTSAFPVASNPARWFRADRGIELDESGNIAVWRDQSRVGANATMTDLARQPTYVDHGLNDQPEVWFGGAQSLYFPTFDSVEFTLFAVGSNANDTGYHSIIIGPGGETGNNQLRWDNLDTLMFVGLDINIPITEIPFGDTRVPHLVTVRYDGSMLEAYRNAELKGGLATISTGGWDVAQLGGWFSSDFMIGTLSEVVMYDRSLSDAELQETQAALLEKYGL